MAELIDVFNQKRHYTRKFHETIEWKRLSNL